MAIRLSRRESSGGAWLRRSGQLLVKLAIGCDELVDVEAGHGELPRVDGAAVVPLLQSSDGIRRRVDRARTHDAGAGAGNQVGDTARRGDEYRPPARHALDNRVRTRL